MARGGNTAARGGSPLRPVLFNCCRFGDSRKPSFQLLYVCLVDEGSGCGEPLSLEVFGRAVHEVARTLLLGVGAPEPKLVEVAPLP